MYDEYGNVEVINHTSLNIGDINPLRYRGYYFDNETGLYYLNSRYYDSNTGRFISADDVDYLGASGSVLSYNLFAYCENNPVNNVDEDGYFALSTIAALLGGALGYIIGNSICKYLGIYGWKRAIVCTIVTASTSFLSYLIVKKIVITYASKALFDSKIANNSVNLIQLLKKYYEKTKKSMDLNLFIKLITICKEYGLKISSKMNDIIGVINHKS